MTMTDTVPGVRQRVLEIERGINDQVKGFRESTVDLTRPADVLLENYDPFAELVKHPLYEGVRMPLKEAFLAKPDAANLLRDGIRFLAFTQMREMPRTWNLIARQETSDRPEEQYIRDAAMGVIPKTPSGQDVPFVRSNLEGGVKIANERYAMGVEVTGDDIRYDRLGKIRQVAFELGRSAVVTEEYNFYNTITTTGNYTRNSTTNDNDVGANTAATTFNALGLDTAMTVISTSKDRHSGQYLGYMADTIITTPKMEMPVKQFLMSNDLVRTHGNTTAEVRGMGNYNPYAGALQRIIVSPWMGTSYQWALCDSRVFSYVWQTVQGWNILQEQMGVTSEAYLIRNALRYVIEGIFGHGFVDDRAWYYSSSTTAPTVS